MQDLIGIWKKELTSHIVDHSGVELHRNDLNSFEYTKQIP